jgi:hypothetical protein
LKGITTKQNKIKEQEQARRKENQLSLESVDLELSMGCTVGKSYKLDRTQMENYQLTGEKLNYGNVSPTEERESWPPPMLKR